MENPNVMTSEGLASLRASLDELEGRGRREIAERIRVAREWGDLKENSEYHDAKNEQAHLETRIARLRDRLSRAVVVEASESGDVVSFGRTVVVRDQDGREHIWEIVSSHEADPTRGRLSHDSPVAQGLQGLRPGEHATIALPRGERILTVVSVS